MRRAVAIGLGLALLACLVAGQRGARAAEPTVEEVEAAFLARFPRFVTWPDSLGTEQAFRVGLLGGDPFGAEGRRLIAARPIQNRRVEVRVLRAMAEAESCRVVFVTEAGQSAGVPRYRGVLTVGEGPDFLAAGGVIAFRVADRRVRFDIDLDAAQALDLRLHSQLIGVADVVRGRRREER